ncbi:UDP-glucoronosyl and UDP-glucosyl transferase [Salvia divinorum]|uniref:Glycosyltransferase n=1 Tax=Salvia divinorum TaxID=28513 RepID=A0ABD1H0T7_SALDI
MAAEIQQLHFVLFPMVAPGHMNPIIDIAKLLARRGLIVSIITTPANAARIGSTISPALQIHLIPIRFPAAEAGLPDACENIDSLPSLEMSYKFITAFDMMQNDVVRAFEQLQPPPSCLISDMGLPWTTQLADQFNIPRMVFHGTSCTSLLTSHHKNANRAEAPYSSDAEATKSTVMKKVLDQVKAAEKTSYGVVVNSFEDLEAECLKEYSEVKGGRVWCIGPVSLCNVDISDMAGRGNISAVDVHDCTKWLDLHEQGSVIYAALGSLARPMPEQMMELALALEESNRPFIWGLGGASSPALEGLFVQSGFTQRTRDRGFLIRGWAPQLVILSHPAIGGFLTHCGWNSTLEGITAGVPLATWPFVGDQFTNEKLVVEILGIGVSVGNKVSVMWGEEEKAGVFVAKDAIKRALIVLMEEGAEMRTRAGELRDKAKMALTQGGSSYSRLTLLIEEIKARF